MPKQKDLSRRDFMKKIGKGTAAIAAAGMIPQVVKSALAAKRDYILIGHPSSLTGRSFCPIGPPPGGNLGQGLTLEVWWSRYHPFKSSLTGETPVDICDAWENEIKRQWGPPVGFKHAGYEIAFDALKRANLTSTPI